MDDNVVRAANQLSNGEIATLRRMIVWFEAMCQAEEDQLNLEAYLADVPTHGDGF